MRKWRGVWVAALVVVAAGVWWARRHEARTGIRPARTTATESPAAGVADLSRTDPLNRPGGTAETDEEAYAIYSALYAAPAGEPLAFADYSSTDIPQVDGSCLKPQTAEERALAEAFVAANRESHGWERRFRIAGGYRLLTAREVNKALECLDAGDRGGAECAAYAGLRHVRFLGTPGLDGTGSDGTGTHALVSVIRKCGRYCGSGGIFEVEKAGGVWRRAAESGWTAECSWAFQK